MLLFEKNDRGEIMEKIQEIFLGKNQEIYSMKVATEEDAAALLEHSKKVRGETDFLLTYPEEFTMTVDEEKEMLNTFRKTKNQFILCVYYKDCIIASAGIMPVMEKKKVLHRASFGVCVEKEHWQQGIGKKLMENSVLLAFQAGYEQIELGVFAVNIRAKEMYEKFGFREWGKIPSAYRLKNGSYRDEILMGLRKEYL